MINAETGYCIFPLCTRIAEREDLCSLHAVHFAGPKPNKVKPSIPKQSEKAKKNKPAYVKKVIAFLSKPENVLCKIKMEGCKKVAECVHHVSGRIGEKLMDENGWMPSCFNCNIAVEIHDKYARENGFKKSKFTIV